ncbi:transferase family-domain-containing protein [Hypoxylon crocopeplum]|nr:transferase family-domain-containing protein [Hypoxylon crocopeplum]
MATLSPLDRLMPRGYVRQMLCFPSTHPDVSRVLRVGLAGVIADLPYLLSGLVVSDDLRQISLSPAYQGLKDLYSEQDLQGAIDYAAMKEDCFPPSAFTVPGIVPPDTQPPLPNPAPVFRAKLSLVKGGYVLCVAVHHCTTDIAGFGAILKIWASHCRTGAAAAVGFDPTWMDREALMGRPDIDHRTAPTSIPELLHVRGPDDFTRLTISKSRPSNLVTSIFFFPQKALQALKHAVNEHIVSQGIAGWASTSDILTALLWSALLAAEQDPRARVGSNNTIGFPVNFRPRFNPPLPSDYLGAAFVMTTATISQKDLISFATNASSPSDDVPLNPTSISRLSKIASTIRTSIHHINEESVQEVLMYLDAVSDDHPPITLGPRHDGISIVSWADQSIYELDWGDVVGRCEAVRLPKLMYKRYPIVLPKILAGINGSEGGFEVIVSFDRQVLERFGQSWLIKRFATLMCYS